MELLFRLIIILSLFLFSGCSMLGVDANFKDGSWSDCTYTGKDKRIVKTPLQVGSQPIAWVEPDGTKVDCVPIPKEMVEGEKTSD